MARVKDVGSRRLYGSPDVAARRGGCIDVDRVAAPGLPDGFAALGGAVADEDLLHAPYLVLVPLEGVLLDSPEHLQEAALDDGVGNGSWQLRGFGAPSRGELEDVGGVEPAILDELERPLVVFFGLAGVANDDVGAKRAVRDGLPEYFDLAPVPLGLVAAVHDL